MTIAYINARMPGTKHDAFIVENDRFKLVGRKARVLNQPIDLIIDLKGHAVLPGFHDAHLHLLGLGKMMDMVDVTKTKSIHEMIGTLKEKETSVILGRGFSEVQFKERRSPVKEDLDQVSSTKPVLLYRFCSHVMIANQAAIDKAHSLHGDYPADTDQYDLETGRFTETSRKWLMALEPEGTGDLRRFILIGQDHLLKHGITSVGSDDFGVVSTDYEDVLDVFKLLGESGRLRLRVLEQVNIADEARFKDFLDKDYPHKAYGRFKLGPVKLLLDGSLGARTAAMRHPYSDAPDETGLLVYDEPFIQRRIGLAREKGMDFAMHAIGDRTIETLIRASEERNESDTRDAIIHAQLADHAQIERMRAKNLGAQIQPAFIGSDAPIVHERLGERVSSTYLFNTMIASGVKTAFSTDAPIEHVNPFHTMYAAMTRQSVEGSQPFNPEESISFEDALYAYTVTPAYFARREKTLGAIKKNHKADFVVVRGLAFDNPESLKAAKVVETYIGGACVYSDRTLAHKKTDRTIKDDTLYLL